MMRSTLFVLLLMMISWLSVTAISERKCIVFANETDIAEKCEEQLNNTIFYTPPKEAIYYFPPDATKKLPRDQRTFFPICFMDPHRDYRFWKDLIMPNDKREKMLRSLFSSFTSWAAENSLKYWIIHGGLIGWYWNEDVLPWDRDIDIMVLYYDLRHFYKPLHGSTYGSNGRYIFEVNPNSVYRFRQKSDIIDARFIDTVSGLYIDITAATYDAHRKMVHCKTPHYYHVDDLFPLRSAKFNGIPTWVPKNVPKILKEEYGSFDENKFVRGKRFWDIKYGSTPYVFNEEKNTWEEEKRKQQLQQQQQQQQSQ